MTSKLHIEPTTKIVVLSAKKASALPRQARGKTVAFARGRGVSISTLRALARTRAIRLVPPRENKTAGVITMLRRKRGATRREVLAATGWKAISFQQVAESTGVKIKVDAKERPFKYRVVG